MSDRWYFAYGSNMDSEQKRARTGPIREFRRARLDGYRIAFNKIGDDRTGKANVVPDATSTVWGAVYRCDSETLEEMDLYEGVPDGHYCRRTLEVLCDSGDVLEAVTYVAGEGFLRSPLVPTPEYLQRVLRGASRHGLPEDYVREIEKAALGDE